MSRIHEWFSNYSDSDWDANEEFWGYFGGLSSVKKLRPAEADGYDENYWRSHRDEISLWE